jgi:putative FmdB family regulatory protein
MPTYRYRCRTCGEELEVWQSITDDPLRNHDGECGGELVKVLSPAGIVLKGSGFYKTDSRSSNGKRNKPKEPASKESGSSDSSSSSSSSSSDSSGSSSTSSDASGSSTKPATPSSSKGSKPAS